MSLPESTTTATAPRAQPTLRERKFARTKLALLQALLDRLREKSMADVTVKELCESAEVSEATFFNYFPRKEEVLHYFVHLWTLEVTWRANEAAGADAGLAYVEYVFRHTAQKVAETPQVMLEIIAKLALHDKPPGCAEDEPPLTLAEKLQAYPELTGIEDLPELQLPDLFAAPITRAVARGELAGDTNVEDVVVALVSVFFGVPLWFCQRDPDQVAVQYERQLKAIWAGHRTSGRV